jgi:hypothetical protein
MRWSYSVIEEPAGRLFTQKTVSNLKVACFNFSLTQERPIWYKCIIVIHWF